MIFSPEALWAGLEWAGVASGLAYVAGAIALRRWCWIAGLVSSALYFVVFARSGLWGQGLLQLLYAGLAVQGYRDWSSSAALDVRRLGHRTAILLVIGLVALATLTVMQASAPRSVDVAIALAALLATWLTVKRYLEAWLSWIAINLCTVALMMSAALYPTALLYGLYAALAGLGLWSWVRVRV